MSNKNFHKFIKYNTKYFSLIQKGGSCTEFDKHTEYLDVKKIYCLLIDYNKFNEKLNKKFNEYDSSLEWMGDYEKYIYKKIDLSYFDFSSVNYYTKQFFLELYSKINTFADRSIIDIIVIKCNKNNNDIIKLNCILSQFENLKKLLNDELNALNDLLNFLNNHINIDIFINYEYINYYYKYYKYYKYYEYDIEIIKSNIQLCNNLIEKIILTQKIINNLVLSLDFVTDSTQNFITTINIASFNNDLSCTIINENYISNDENTIANTNIFNDILKSLMNIGCESKQLIDIKNKIIKNNKKIYIFDYVNFVILYKIKNINITTTENNLINEFKNFLKYQIQNNNYVIIVFKENNQFGINTTHIKNIIDEGSITEKLNINIFIIQIEPTELNNVAKTSNNDDFIFWIICVYFFHNLYIYNKINNIYFMTNDKQNLVKKYYNESDYYTNNKNILNFESINCYLYISNAENNKILLSDVYIKIFINLVRIADSDKLKIANLYENIESNDASKINLIKKIDEIYKSDNKNLTQIFTDNLISPGLIFYATIKYIQKQKPTLNETDLLNIINQSEKTTL